MNIIHINSNFPEFQSKRLKLRDIKNDDRIAIFNIRSNSEINEFIDRNLPDSIEEIDSFIKKIKYSNKERSSYYWVIEDEGKRIIGTICLWNFSDDKRTAEIGYELLPEFQKKGIMTESINIVLTFAKYTLKLSSLYANTHKKNLPSIRLLLKTGFIYCSDMQDPENGNNIIFMNGFNAD